MNIIEFLEARIAEDELRANYYGPLAMGTARVLAECAAKRAIIEQHPGDGEGYCYDPVMHQRGCQWTWPCPTLTALAAVYKDHATYQQEWAHGND